MNIVAVAIVSAIVHGHPFNKSRLLIGSKCILLCLKNSTRSPRYMLLLANHIPPAYTLFNKKLRSGPSTESFLAFGDFSFSTFKKI